MNPTAVLSPVVRAAKVPLGAAAYTVGALRGVAASLLRAAAGEREPAPAEEASKSESGQPTGTQRTGTQEAADQRAPEPPAESFAHEPTAVTRTSAHGGRGADAEIDDWYGDVDAEDGPDGVVEALEQGDGSGPLIDKSAIQSTLTEYERMRGSSES
jgi:hypothetical protein